MYSILIEQLNKDIAFLEKRKTSVYNNEIEEELFRLYKQREIYSLENQKFKIEAEERKKKENIWKIYANNNNNYNNLSFTPTIFLLLLGGGIPGLLLGGGVYLLHNKLTKDMTDEDITTNYKRFLSNYNKNNSIKSNSYLSNFK